MLRAGRLLVSNSFSDGSILVEKKRLNKRKRFPRDRDPPPESPPCKMKNSFKNTFPLDQK